MLEASATRTSGTKLAERTRADFVALFGSGPIACRRAGRERAGTMQVLAVYRLIAPGSERRLHRQWFANSAMADLMGSDFGLAEAHKLYACHDPLLAHKDALFAADVHVAASRTTAAAILARLK